MSTEVDYYELLECERTADDATIKSSYRKLAMKYHPDKNPGCKDSEAKFKAISEAYDCLKDPQKRAAYDRFGHAAFQNGGGGRRRRRRISAASPTSSRASSASSWAVGRGGRAQQRARRRPALRHGDHAGGRVPRQGDRDHRRRLRAVRHLPRLGREARHRRARPARTCDGHGKVRAQQGFFVVERTCPTCHGAGAGDRRSVPRLPRRGPGRQDQDADRQRPAGRRRGHAHPPDRRGRGGRARRAGGRPLHLPPRQAARAVRARGHDAVRARADQLHHRGAGRRRSRSRGSTAQHARDPHPAPASSRASNCASAARACRCCRAAAAATWSSRSRSRRRPSCRRAQKRTAGGVPRDRDGRRMPAVEGFFAKVKKASAVIVTEPVASSPIRLEARLRSTSRHERAGQRWHGGRSRRLVDGRSSDVPRRRHLERRALPGSQAQIATSSTSSCARLLEAIAAHGCRWQMLATATMRALTVSPQMDQRRCPDCRPR